MVQKIGRNAPCPCGSGNKYKKCCLGGPSRSAAKLQRQLSPPRRVERHLNIVPSVEFQERRVRAIRNKIIARPLEETFHEFLILLLKARFGEGWRQNQMAVPPEKRHVLIQWVDAWREWRTTMRVDENRDGDHWAATSSGEVRALVALAYDLFCLEVTNRLPRFLVRKLKDRHEYQGARYEIAVAAIIARAGFEIEFLDKKIIEEKHCEFIATHKETRIKMGVEAKSRRRKGVLHEPGELDLEEVRVDIGNLLDDALLQRPSKLPYLVFIDINVPATTEKDPRDIEWIKDLESRLKERGLLSQDGKNQDPLNALVVTNYSYYYAGEAQAPRSECLVAKSVNPQIPIQNPRVMSSILESLSQYSQIPNEV